jgi:hypothetical protein
VDRYVRRFVIVCGYGCDLDKPLKPYLDRVLEYCRKHRPIAIILCGGATQRARFPGLTEAEVMQRYLAPLHREFQPKWYALGNSYTTFENIRDASLAVEQLKRVHGEGNNEIVIFCEATRGLKVALLARHFMGFPPAAGEPDIRIETDSWERGIEREFFGTAWAWLAIRFPIVNAIQSWRVRRKSLTR